MRTTIFAHPLGFIPWLPLYIYSQTPQHVFVLDIDIGAIPSPSTYLPIIYLSASRRGRECVCVCACVCVGVHPSIPAPFFSGIYTCITQQSVLAIYLPTYVCVCVLLLFCSIGGGGGGGDIGVQQQQPP